MRAKDRTLTQRRRTAGSPQVEALEQVEAWLKANRRRYQWDPHGHVLLHRPGKNHPWAEVGRYRDVFDMAVSMAIIPRRPR